MRECVRAEARVSVRDTRVTSDGGVASAEWLRDRWLVAVWPVATECGAS